MNVKLFLSVWCIYWPKTRENYIETNFSCYLAALHQAQQQAAQQQQAAAVAQQNQLNQAAAAAQQQQQQAQQQLQQHTPNSSNNKQGNANYYDDIVRARMHGIHAFWYRERRKKSYPLIRSMCETRLCRCDVTYFNDNSIIFFYGIFYHVVVLFLPSIVLFGGGVVVFLATTIPLFFQCNAKYRNEFSWDEMKWCKANRENTADNITTCLRDKNAHERRRGSSHILSWFYIHTHIQQKFLFTKKENIKRGTETHITRSCCTCGKLLQNYDKRED